MNVIPTVVSSRAMNVIPSVVEESRSLDFARDDKPCATLSRDDKEEEDDSQGQRS